MQRRLRLAFPAHAPRPKGHDASTRIVLLAAIFRLVASAARAMRGHHIKQADISVGGNS